MKSPMVAYIGWLLILAALGFYGYGIVQAILLSWGTTVPVDYTNYPETLSTTMSSIQALLLTNLGVMLLRLLQKKGFHLKLRLYNLINHSENDCMGKFRRIYLIRELYAQ